MTDSFEEMWRGLAPVGRSGTSGGYFRQPWLPAELEMRAWFREQAAARDLPVEEDPFGNLVAWWSPATSSSSSPRGTSGRIETHDALLTGSHLDSVPDGGAYDGPLGVVSGFAAIDRLRARGVVPARPVGVAAFVEEEGSRFGRACLGSRLATGSMTWERARALTDADGVRLGDVIEGGAPTDWLSRVGCYVELHVEQGRGLIEHDAAVGRASMIWPHGRWRYDFSGRADHAGTTRMADRLDPMISYAATALAANEQARLADHRATFGRVEVTPNGTNAVPSRVIAWLDARAESEAALDDLVAVVGKQAADRAGRDGTSLTVTAESVTGAVEFDPTLGDAVGPGLPALATQAGHDAGILQAAGIPTGMLFVRNPTGVSHSPEEHADLTDCLAGVEALAAALERLAS